MKSLVQTFLALCGLLALGLSAEAKTGWTDDYAKALAEAKAANKLVLLNFTGSDWCLWCGRLDKEIFDKPSFQNYAKEHLVLVELDFPVAKHLSAKVEKQNDGLRKRFEVEGFPNLVVVDGNGKLVKQFPDYPADGPEAFVAKLSALKK